MFSENNLLVLTGSMVHRFCLSFFFFCPAQINYPPFKVSRLNGGFILILNLFQAASRGLMEAIVIILPSSLLIAD